MQDMLSPTVLFGMAKIRISVICQLPCFHNPCISTFFLFSLLYVRHCRNLVADTHMWAMVIVESYETCNEVACVRKWLRNLKYAT